MSAAITGRERGESSLDQQAEIRLRELQSPTAARQSDRDFYEQTVIGQLLKAPDQLDRVSILEPADFASPDYRAWLTALRTLAKHRGTLTGDDVPAVIDAASELMKRPVAEMATQAELMIECVWSTANVEDSALKVRRQAAEARLDAAMKARDIKKTRAALAAIDALDEIKAGQSKAKSDTAILIRGSTVTPEPISWLWGGWLARGKLHVLAGQPGTGKTNLAMALAAGITVGGYAPDGTRLAPKSVVIWSGEDSIQDTLTPRLMANGADMDRVHFVNTVRTRKGVSRPFDPAVDLPLLQSAIERNGEEIGLFIVDSVADVVMTDGHQNNKVRRALAPLVELAEKTKCAALGITHLTKASGDRDPIDRIVGSVAFGGLARVVMMAAKVASENGGGQILVRVKSNIGPDGDGYRYEIGNKPIDGYPGVSGSYVTYGEKMEGRARDLISMAETIVDPEEQGAISEAKAFIANCLADGPMKVTELEAAGKGAGITKRTMERARKTMGVKSRKGFDGTWRCYLDIQKVGGVGGVGGVGEILTKAAKIDGQGRQGRQTVGGLETVINQEDNLKAAKAAKAANVFKNSDESADAATLEAEGRRLLEEAKTAPSGVKVLPTGEYVDDPAPGSRVDLRNRGNLLLEQARVMRLSEDGKRESPPTHAAPPICRPAEGYPFRLIVKCDKPMPIYGPDGGDPVGCESCGARWGARP